MLYRLKYVEIKLLIVQWNFEDEQIPAREHNSKYYNLN